MKNILKKTIAYLLILSFPISNSAYSLSVDSNALRPKSSVYTFVEESITERLRRHSTTFLFDAPLADNNLKHVRTLNLSPSSIENNFTDRVNHITKNWERIKKEGAFVFDVDGTLFATEDLRMTLNDTRYKELREAICDILEEGVKFYIISASGKKKQSLRIVEPIVERLKRRHNPEVMKNFIIYTSTGGFRTDFNAKGEEISPKPGDLICKYNFSNSMPTDDIEIVRKTVEYVVNKKLVKNNEFLKTPADKFRVEEYRKNGNNTLKCPSNELDYFNKYKCVVYGQGDMPLPNRLKGKTIYAPWIETSGKIIESGKERFIQFTITALPDDMNSTHLIRKPMLDAIRNVLGKTYNVNYGGGRSIDITHKINMRGEQINKALAMRNAIKSDGLKTKYVFYFADNYQIKGVADQPLLDVLHKDNCLAVCADEEENGAIRIGDNYSDMHRLIIAIRDGIKTLSKSSSVGNRYGEDAIEISSVGRFFSQFMHEQDQDVLRTLINTAEKAMKETDANPEKKEILSHAILAGKMRLLCKFPLQSTEEQTAFISRLRALKGQWQKAFEKLSLQASKVPRTHSPDQHAALQYKLKMYNWFLYTFEQDIAELEGRSPQAFLRNLGEKSSSSGIDVFSAEGGFVFFNWSKKPDTLAFGKYGSLESKSDKLGDNVIVRFNSELKKVKSRLLREGFFDKEDFNVTTEVVYPAYKAATYLRKRDTIILDRRCFENDDFLYFKIKHELTDRKLPEMDIIGEHFKELPGLRELFTLITVDIKGFMYLRDHYPAQARDMLEYCRSVGHQDRGLLRCYEKIMKSPLLIDPFDFTEDIFRLVESEKQKAYFPNMRKAVRKIASKNSDGSINYETTSVILRPWLKAIHRQLLELQNVREKSQFRPLTDLNKNTPLSLRPFMPYAKDVYYQLDNDCIFLRIKLNNNQNQARFAYLYIGLNDDWDSILGKRGKIYNLAYHKWRHTSTGLFWYMHDGIEKNRAAYWNQLSRLSITKLMNKLYDKSSQKKLRRLFIGLCNDLMIETKLSTKTWLSIKNLAGTGRKPGRYYVINNIIWEHINRMYPKLFLGEKNLRGFSIADMPTWLVVKDPEMSPNILSFLNPCKRQEPTSFYEQADKVSMRDIIKMLKERKADAQSTASFQLSPGSSVYQANLSLFDGDKPETPDLRTGQEIRFAVYSAA